MSIPLFSAQASLYKSCNRYLFTAAGVGGSNENQSVVATYVPGPHPGKMH